MPERGQPRIIPTVRSFDLSYSDLERGEVIGSGGNADVYRAAVRREGERIDLAVKEPRIKGTLHTEQVDKLLSEAETWAQLDSHDHIVGIVDWGAEPLPWIAMEYMDGGDLSEKPTEIGLSQKLWTALKITSAVRHAHRRGVAHLDLKPANVLFRTTGSQTWPVAKVADWGLSKQLLHHSQSIDGLSPNYAAPEQFDDDYGNADDITDVYQLGAVCYSLFTGRPPFEGPATNVMHKVLTEQPTPPTEIDPTLPSELDDILMSALAKRKKERYDSVVYIRDALQDMFDDHVSDTDTTVPADLGDGTAVESRDSSSITAAETTGSISDNNRSITESKRSTIGQFVTHGRNAGRSILNKSGLTTINPEREFTTWRDVDRPAMGLLFILAVLGEVFRKPTQEIDDAAAEIGPLGVFGLAFVLWGGLTGLAYVRFSFAGFIAVGAASAVAILCSLLAVLFRSVAERGKTVAFAYPFAMTAIFLPPLVVALYSPTLTEAVFPNVEYVPHYIIHSINWPVGLQKYTDANSLIRTPYDITGVAFAWLWFGIAVPVGWVLGILVTLADLVRPKPRDSDDDSD